LHYVVEPFQLVEAQLTDGVVSSIVLHFESPASPTQCSCRTSKRLPFTTTAANCWVAPIRNEAC
jgi:hypothetical protein